MKWFKHSVHARSEHGTEDILRCHGPAGIGIYWCLLEMLARDTEHFRLRIAGVNAEADERFEQARSDAGRQPPARHLYRVDLLARTLNTDTETIIAVIALGVSEGLFERDLWQTYSVLHSPGFCRQADEYTRRLRRSSHRSDSGGPGRGPTPETLHEAVESLGTDSAHGAIEEMREEKRKIQPPASRSGVHISATPERAAPPHGVLNMNDTTQDLDRLLLRCRMLVADWNRHNGRDFELRLSRVKLRRLTGGDPLWRQRLCYESMNLTHGGSTFQDVILRALWLMLEASRSRPITDQFAWLWSCIHGTRDSPPWVHRPTAAEESRPRGRRQSRGEGEFQTIGEILARRTSADGGSHR